MSKLNENILKVKETFDEIALAIEEKGVDITDLDAPTTYADKIRSIVGENTGLDPDKLYVEACDAGDSEPFVIKSRTEDGGVLLTFGLKQGPQGSSGEKGAVGPKGLPGEKGEAGVSYRVVSVYTTTDSVNDVPGIPKGGHGDMKTNTLSLPVTDNGTRGWSNIDDEPNPKKFVGVSNVTFQDSGNPIGKGSAPFRINGEDGKNGADGRVIEFIYRLLPNYDSYITLRNFLNKPENKLPSPNEMDYVPDVNDNLNIDTKGEDRPIGVDPVMQVEVVCSRIRNSIDEPWSEWSNCTIGSKGGEDGVDGDGIEYIYIVTPSEINGVPTTSEYVKELLVPAYSLDGDYQKDEFCFNDKWGFEGYDWTDEPTDVGPGKPMEGVMVRKQKDGVGQSFSDPALWATYSEDGVSYITSFVFARGNVDNPPARPEGGDYFDPKPNGNIGSDTVPSDSNLPVGMSTRVFCSTKEYSDNDWSEPKMLTDTPDFQVEYSTYKGEISREKIDKFEGESTEENEQRWRDSQKEKYGIEWGDDSQIKDPIWMITASRHGGIGSDGTISKIKGEKGDKGDPGSSVRIEGEFETLDQLKTAGNKYVTTGDLSDFSFYSKDGVINQGDGWYVKEEGKLYSYSGGGYVGESNTDFDKYWFGVEIKGEPGDSAYMYIAYCNENVATATVDLIGPGKYIGVSTKDLSEEDRLKGSSYTGTKGEGEDGGGYEQIFLATSKDLNFDPENNHLPIPTNNEQVPEYLPPHAYGINAYPSDKWSDSPISPSKEYPFCGVVTRKVKNNKFENGTGRDGMAALYSRGSYDGVSGVFVDLSNDLAVVPMQDGKIDPDFVGPVETVVKVYVGDEEVESSEFVVTGNNVTVNGAVVTLNLSGLLSNVKTIPLHVKLGNKTYTVNGNIVQTDVAYELTPKTYSIRRYADGDKVGHLELDELRVDIWKGSDGKGTASNIPLFAHVVYTNGKEEVLSTSDGRVTVSKNGVATVNLKDLLDIASIKIYVVAPNNNGEYLSNGEVLSFENITIVSDGKDGKDGVNGADGVNGVDGVSIVGKGEFDNRQELISKLGEPQNGWAYKDLDDKIAYVYQSNAGYIMSVDGKSGSDGVDGKPIVWKGDLTNPPANPELNGCYRDLDNGRIYIYDSISNDGDAGWALMVKDGDPGVNGKDGVDGTNSIIKGSFDTLDEFKEQIAGAELANRPQDLAFCYIVEGDLYVGHGSSNEVLLSSQIEVSKTETLGMGNNTDAAKEKAYTSAYSEALKKALENLNSLLSNKNSSNPGGSFNGDIEYIMVGDPEYSNIVSTGITFTATCLIKLVAKGNISRTKEVGKNVGRFIGHDGISRYKSTVFKRSDVVLTERPTGGSGENPRPDDTTWEDGIPDGTGKIGSSFREFYNDEKANAVYEGSVPKLMVDNSGFEVAYGTLSVESNESLLIGLPVINDKANPNGDFTNGGTDEPAEDVDYYYMATATNDNGVWSAGTVTKIKGENGKDGVSGKDGLSVYITYHDNDVTSKPDKPSGDGTSKGWHTDPTENVNWMSQKVALNANEGEWGDPIQIRGIDGIDGVGTEYIFCVTGPIGASVSSAILHNELLGCYDVSGEYQNDNFVPSNSSWTNEPLGVNEYAPLEWVSIRKKVNGIGGKFSMPIIWNTYVTDGKNGVDGKDAVSYKTSYVFTRSTSTPNNPEGGKFETGLPTNINVGSDTIPSSGDGEVGMSYRMFRSDNANIGKGSTPVKMTDTCNFEVLYGTEGAQVTDLPTLPILDGYDSKGGYDEAVSGIAFHYMATATFNDGKGSNWIVSKIKGEKGDKGEDGKSVSIKGHFDTIEDLQLAGSKYFTDPQNAGFVYPLYMGDGYLVEGDLGVYDGDTSSFNEAWNNVGKIQGEPGTSAHFYVGYRNSLDETEVITDGRGGKYVGIKISNKEISPNDLKNPDTYDSWNQGHGDDGWGGEQVFKATSTNEAPTIKQSDKNKTESELRTEGGSDRPISVNDTDHQYIWYLFRKSTDSWKGESEDSNYIYAALFDRYAKDGEQGESGNDAPIIYPAGVGNPNTKYIAESNKVPYVLYSDEKYYMLNSKELIIGEGEGSEWSGNSCRPGALYEEEPIGLPIDSFEAIYADIGMFKQALVGKGVFHGNYMFSQDGVDASGNLKKYSDFADPKSAIANGTFKPNVLFNSVTGEMFGNNVTINNGALTFDSDSFRMETDNKRSVTIYNGELISDTPFGSTFTPSGNFKTTRVSSMHMPQNQSSSSVNHSITISTAFLGTNSSLSIGTFTATIPTVQGSGGTNTSVINAVSSLTGTVKLYYGTTLLHTLNKTSSPNSNVSGDLSELNDYIDLKQNPGVYTIDIRIGNTFKANSTTESGSFTVSKDLTFNWEYDNSAETIIGSNGILSSNENGFTYIGDVFKTIQNLYGLKVDTSGIKYTKDGGENGISLI